MIEKDPIPRMAVRGVGRIGLIGSVVLFTGFAGWAWATEIGGAVIAAGSVVVSGKTKVVQHADGGVVEEILVADGESVAAGEVLLRLDDTTLRANLEIYRARLADLLAKRARLEAERGEAGAIAFREVPPILAGTDIETAREGQRQIFEARRELRAVREEQLGEAVAQFANQIAGVEALAASKREQLAYLEEELSAAESLREKRLVLSSQVLELQKGKSDLLGQIAEHESELARIRNSIRDKELEVLSLGRQQREAAVAELHEAVIQSHEIVQQIASTEEQLARVEIRAPVNGLVHEMQIATVGGVVPPGGAILEIVPSGENLAFEVRVDPVSVDQVHLGQTATARFTAFNQRTTPELVATVAGVSPNAVTDEATGLSYYRVRLDVSEDELARLGAVDLIPGMPVEAHLQTGDRTVLSYLAKPLADQMAQAFREE